MNSKRGQLTVFIILALVLIFIIIILLVNRGDLTSIFKTKSPVEKITECAQDSLKEAIAIISVQGGKITPENYFLYQDNKIEYLCFNTQDYKPCKVQNPLLKLNMELELKKYTDSNFKNCLNSIKTNLENRGSIVTFKEPKTFIELLPNSAFINIDLDLTISRQDSTKTYKNIKTSVNSNLYEFSEIASRISNDEVTIGDVETILYMLRDKPWLKLEKKKQSDGTKIYILTNRNTDEQFWFATRSFAMPPGALT